MHPFHSASFPPIASTMSTSFLEASHLSPWVSLRSPGSGRCRHIGLMSATHTLCVFQRRAPASRVATGSALERMPNRIPIRTPENDWSPGFGGPSQGSCVLFGRRCPYSDRASDAPSPPRPPSSRGALLPAWPRLPHPRYRSDREASSARNTFHRQDPKTLPDARLSTSRPGRPARFG